MSLLQLLPFPLGSRPSGSDLASVTGIQWDCAIGGIPFLLDTTQEPLRRRTNEYLRDQVDTSREVGEQSLTGWWLRSQSRFDEGAGIRYFEPILGEGSGFRFRDSVGLDVFGKEGVRLARRMDAATIVALPAPVWTAANTNKVHIAANSTSKFAEVSTSGVYSEVTSPSSTGGVVAVAVGPDGTLWRSDTGGISNGSATWTITGSAYRIWWVKSRLFAGRGGDLYELTGVGGALSSKTPLAVPEANTTGWSWVSVTETPNAVWAAGVDSFGHSRVYVITLDENSQTVMVEAMKLPYGETVLDAYGYLDYVILGTSRGIRVCPTSGDQAALGPLLGDEFPVHKVTAYADSVYGAGKASHDGYTGIYRVDLSHELDGGRFPWAKESYTASSATPVGIDVIPTTSRLVLTLTDGIYIQHATAPVNEGWLRTGLTRWGTFERKFAEAVKVNADVVQGNIQVEASDGASEFVVGGVTGSTNGGTLQMDLPGVPVEAIGLRFTLTPGSSGEPTLYGYQIRGFPVPARQRLISVPLRVHDFQADRHGSMFGREMFGTARVMALELLEESGTPVVWQDFRTGESRRCIILRQTTVHQTSPDGIHPNAEGTVVVELLALDNVQLAADDFESAPSA